MTAIQLLHEHIDLYPLAMAFKGYKLFVWQKKVHSFSQTAVQAVHADYVSLKVKDSDF